MSTTSVSATRFLTRDDQHVATFNLATTHRPAYVLAARTAYDVATEVRFAAQRGLGVAVQATGHGAAAAVDGGASSAPPACRTCRSIQSRERRKPRRVKWRWVIDAAAPHGLAPLNGSSSDVGAVGYTVGGG